LKANSHWRVFVAAILLFGLAFLAVLVSLPDNFQSAMDMALSATGLGLSRSYYAVDLFPTLMQPGYVIDGVFHIYPNWPGFGFKVLSAWYHLLGNDSIYSARLLAALLYGVSAALFFTMLLRWRIEWSIAILSTLIFILLPHHFEFGRLIYADIWLLPCWLVCFVIYSGSAKYYWLIMPIAIIACFGFMWFAIFVGPAFGVMYCHHRYALSVSKTVLLVLSLLALAYVTQYLLIVGFPDVPILWELKQWSIFPLAYNTATNYNKLISAVIRVSYESIAVVCIVGWAFYRYGSAVWQSVIGNANSINAFAFIGITLIFTVGLFPSWFLTHNNGTAFFSVFIAGMAAVILQACSDRHCAETRAIGAAMVVMSMVLLISYSYLKSGGNSSLFKAQQIIAHIQHNSLHKKHQLQARPNIVFHLRNTRQWGDRHGVTMGVKEVTRGYLFFARRLQGVEELPDFFQQHTQILEERRDDFDSKHVYFVTDEPNFVNESVAASELKIRAETLIDNWYLYDIEL